MLFGQQASYLPLFFIHHIHFFSVSFEAQSVSPHSDIKRGRTADFSHRVYLIEQLHISLSCHCMRIKAVAQSFLLPDNIKAICFVLWNVRSTGEIAKRSRNCDVNERQTEGGSHNGSVWVKRKTRGEREMRRREEGARR